MGRGKSSMLAAIRDAVRHPSGDPVGRRDSSLEL